MTYEEARAFLEGCNQYAGGVYTLAPLKELLARLGNPQEKLRFVHIAGTNGKGSALAYLSTVLKEAGYRVGRYFSPAVFDYREQIQVDGEHIPKEALARLAGRMQEAGRQMLKEGLGHPTTFEAETALAFLWFAERDCDLVVLETGMGGRLDATNVVRNTIAAVFASISMDHMGVLGDTLSEIARNKAGIIKPGCTVVTLHQEPEAERAIREQADGCGCPVMTAEQVLVKNQKRGLFVQSFDYKGWEAVQISLSGEYQFMNAALVLETIGALREKGIAIPEEAVRKGMGGTVWNARFSVLSEKPLFLMDGAHNRDAAQKLKETIAHYLPGRRLIYIMGVLADKEYEAVAEKTAFLASQIITVETPDNPRALPAEALAAAVEKYNPCVCAAKSLSEAVDMAYGLAGEEDVILAFGSLSYLGALAREVRRRKR